MKIPVRSENEISLETAYVAKLDQNDKFVFLFDKQSGMSEAEVSNLMRWLYKQFNLDAIGLIVHNPKDNVRIIEIEQPITVAVHQESLK